MAEKLLDSGNQAAVQQTALELFARTALSRGYSAEQRARKAFEDAAVFHAVANDFAGGKFKPGVKEPESELSDASAPNLPDDHPINMISRSRGSIAKRKELLNRLREPEKHNLTMTSKDPGRNIPYLQCLLGTTAEALSATN